VEAARVFEYKEKVSRFTRTSRGTAGLRLGLLLVISALAPGCTLTRGTALPKIAAEINATLEGLDFTLVPGDSITIKFLEDELAKWNQNVVLRTDGKAALYHLDDVALAGFTVSEARERIQSVYDEVFPHPLMTISFTKTGARNVYIIGQVRSPGPYSVNPGQYPVSPGQNPIFAGQSGLSSDPISLLELFAYARGPLLNQGALQNTRLMRWDPEKRTRRTWIIDARTKHWDSAQPIWMQPYDIVFVPNMFIVDIDQWVAQYIKNLIPLPYLFPTGIISPTGN
jgi:protein involved in polysaccharide export with SLBB domain